MELTELFEILWETYGWQVILIPVVAEIISLVLKGITKFKDEFIPLVNLSVGTILGVSLIQPSILGGVIGFVLAGLTIVGFNVIKQLKK